MEGADDELLAGARSRVGRVLKDKWHLDKLLGLGGMAAVYEATHRNRSRVAVKMLHPSLSLDREVRQRFLREGYVANSVEHEGVVRVLDDDVDDDGTAFLVLDLLEGETLDARWARAGGRLPIEEVVPLMARILEVLAAAHVAGIVHRDVKPENIFLTNRGEVRLLDFGIARLRETAQSSEQAALTRSGATMGTPVFMAPEQARGRWEQVDERTDVWALGAMMFTLLSGHWVHEAETWNETLILAAIRPARSLADVVPEAPAALVAIVDRALAFEKADRWASAQAMQAALKALSPAELLPQRIEYLRTQPAPSSVRVGFGKGDADPLSATDPGWPSVFGTRPPQSEPGRGPLASGPGRTAIAPASRGSRASFPSSPRGSRPDSAPAVSAIAPSPTVVPAIRTSPDDDEPSVPKSRGRFPTWVVLLAVAGGGVYAFRENLLPHLDAWSARSAVSAAPASVGRPEAEGPNGGRAEGEASEGREAAPPPAAATHETAAATAPPEAAATAPPPPSPTADPTEAEIVPPPPDTATPAPLVPPLTAVSATPKPPVVTQPPPAAKPPAPTPTVKKPPPPPPKPPPRSTKTPHKPPAKHRR